jgi:NO-binding membrane sensor protein with MHYT domain
MRQQRSRHADRLALAMLLGALIGFGVGAVIGLSSIDLAAPVLWPFAGAAAGVLVAAVVAGALGRGTAVERARQRAVERDAGHARFRDEARRGWIEGIDLTADAPPRPGAGEPDR